MKRLRAGLVGAGLVGQAEHAFYLWEDRERFDFVGLADASAAVRNALGARYGIQQLHADLPSLLKAAKLDALVIAAPDPFHPDLAVTALEAGLHVLCEKPLSLTLSGCDRIKAARDKAGTVLQVAYMKRHDPAFKKALLDDASQAVGTLGHVGRTGDHLVAVENTPQRHNMVVCTLCSCYPWEMLGLPPVWYKAAPYRSRAVKDPRGVLADFGITLPKEMEIRVWDSTAETRFLVLPMRPTGTEGWSEQQLAELVTRDSMIGTGFPKTPGAPS